MTASMTVEHITTSTDVDALWAAFLAAREDGDLAVADAARDRMAALQERRQFDTLDDEQLEARLAALQEAQDADPTAEREAEIRSLLDETDQRDAST